MIHLKKAGIFIFSYLLLNPLFIQASVIHKPISIGEHHICVITITGVRCLGENGGGQTDVPADLVNPVHISVGSENTCVIDDNGVRCWGNILPKYKITSHFSNPVQVESGYYNTCVLDDNGVHCWGTNSSGQLNIPIKLHNPVQISVGERHNCAVGDSEVICWGDNGWGQTSVPTDLINPIQVSAGKDHSCAIDDNGVHCWGGVPIVTSNSFTNPTWKKLPPKKIIVPTDLKNPTQVSAGNTQTCVLDGADIRCWGEIYGEYSMNLPANDWVPKNLINPTFITTSNVNINRYPGGNQACAIDESGFRCWGNVQYNLDSIIDLKNPIKVIAGGDRTCVIEESGELKCWGGKDQTPVHPDLKAATDVSMGDYESCVLLNGQVKCWSSWSQTNLKSYTPLTLQKKVTPENNELINPVQISIGYKHGCILDSLGVYCWGDDDNEQASVPDDLNNPSQISLGGNRSCVLDSGKVRCWGRDIEIPVDLQNPTQLSLGQFYLCVLDDIGVHCSGGDKSLSASRNIPTNIINPNQIKVGYRHICVLDDEGMKCWGHNEQGQTDVPADLKNPRQITVGKNHTCVLDDFGVHCWGENNAGQTNIPRKLDLPLTDNTAQENKSIFKCLFPLKDTVKPEICLLYAPEWWKW